MRAAWSQWRDMSHGRAVEGVADDGVAGGGEVAADLVGDAGEDDDVEQRNFRAGFDGRPFGEGGKLIAGGQFIRIAHDGHLAGAARLVRERGVEASGGIDDAVN